MNTERLPEKNFIIAAIFGLVSAASLSLTGAYGNHLTQLSNLSIIVFLRFFIPFIILIIPYLFSKKIRSFKEIHFSYYIRAACVFISQYCFFFLLSKGNILLAILMYSTSGIFTPFLSRLFFKHPLRRKTVIAIALSVIGVAIILGPIKQASALNISIGLLSGLLGSCSQITMHYISKIHRPNTVVFLNYCICSVIAALLIFIGPAHISASAINSLLTPHGIYVIVLFSLFSIANQASRSYAYSHLSQASLLAPFLNTALIFSALANWIWLDIAPTWHTYLGIAIIIFGSVIISIYSIKHPETDKH